MTAEELCERLIATGWIEYPADNEHIRNLESPGRLTGPDCACNDKPAPLLIEVGRDMLFPGGDTYTGRVSFKSFGERADGLWFRQTVYSADRAGAEAMVDSARATLSACWRAFCDASGPAPLDTE